MGQRRATAADMDTLLQWIENGDDPPTQRSVRAGAVKFGLDLKSIKVLLRTDEFAPRYTRAVEERGVEVAESLHQIAERTQDGEIDPAAARVAIDALKWTSSRLLAPRRLGERVDVTTDGKALPATTAVFVVGRDVVDRVASENGHGDGDEG
jgi:hypothetical protein